jgi:PIN domain nuclease of toxin-antitoxin system
LARLHEVLNDPAYAVDVAADETVFEAWERIDRKIIKDPWDRMIMASAIALKVPLVTKDSQITASGLVPTIW